MIRPLPVLLLAALCLVQAGCPISQAIIISYPEDASWSFKYRDALGEELGGGKASVAFSSNGTQVTMLLTEGAFGDHARLTAKLQRSPDAPAKWLPFAGTGVWFSGEAFAFSGCINPAAGKIAPGAAAYPLGERARLQGHPLLKDPCQRGGEIKRFKPAQVDKVFTWSARLDIK